MSAAAFSDALERLADDQARRRSEPGPLQRCLEGRAFLLVQHADGALPAGLARVVAEYDRRIDALQRGDA